MELSQTFSSGEGTAAPRDEDTFVGAGLMVGEYKIEGMLAEGGMGVVYAGVHPLIRKRVAIKVINRRFAQDLKAVSRFVLEARSVNEIGHHNIVDIFAIGELDDGRNYLVMELIDGVSLFEILLAANRLQPGEVLPLYEQLCDALEVAHAKGFIHRDLKPANILVLKRPPHPFIKILDFGLAKLRGPSQQQGEQTAVGTVVGTPTYMAPEQCLGDPVDPRTDVYALGVMLYELLTGKPPFVDAAPQRVLAMHIHKPPRPPSVAVPGLPKPLEAVVLKALAKRPAERHPSASALYEELRAAIPSALPWAHLLEDLQPTKVAPIPAMSGGLAEIPIAMPPSARKVSSFAPEEVPSSGLSAIMDAPDDDGETTRRVEGVPSFALPELRANVVVTPATLPPGELAPPSIDGTLDELEGRDSSDPSLPVPSGRIAPSAPRLQPETLPPVVQKPLPIAPPDALLASGRTLVGLGDLGLPPELLNPSGATLPLGTTPAAQMGPTLPLGTTLPLDTTLPIAHPDPSPEALEIVALAPDEEEAFGETQPLPQLDVLAAPLADTKRVPALADAPAAPAARSMPARPTSAPSTRSEPRMILELGEPSGEISSPGIIPDQQTLAPGRPLPRRRGSGLWVLLLVLVALGGAAAAFYFLRS
jgi:serine/threonine-protein kinase